ncbi:MAG TPA: GNAT family N-acetyltransferase [Pedococcus sp.]|nr:GNAT family N-acetyltransferase [Pedococcus sp.]
MLPPDPSHDHASHDHASHDHSQQRGPLADASVRLARQSDAPAVGIVQAVVWREAYAEVIPVQALETFEPQAFGNVWRRSLENPPPGVHRLLVACAGDQVVGFAAIGPSQDPDTSPETGELTALGVHPHARRAGHGSRLLNAAVDTLRGAGATAMSTWVLAADEGTRAFLTQSGLAPDSAFRDRVVSPDGDTAREVRLVASLAQDEPQPTQPES